MNKNDEFDLRQFKADRDNIHLSSISSTMSILSIFIHRSAVALSACQGHHDRFRQLKDNIFIRENYIFDLFDSKLN